MIWPRTVRNARTKPLPLPWWNVPKELCHTYVRDWDFIGTVDSWENGVAHCTQRGKFAVGDSIEILQPDGSVVKLTPAWIENADGERVDATPHPMMQYTIPCETPLMAYSLIRMQKQ